jgi:hypothetical protein
MLDELPYLGVVLNYWFINDTSLSLCQVTFFRLNLTSPSLESQFPTSMPFTYSERNIHAVRNDNDQIHLS